jgi:hypothetical protein
MIIYEIGKLFIPSEQVAYVEPFDPSSSNPEFKPEKDFKPRIVLINRDTVLAGIPMEEFVEKHGFKLLAEDQLALNVGPVNFRVEAFAPSEDFNPVKPYRSRLRWRALDNTEHSKLLLIEPALLAALAAASRPAEENTPKKGRPWSPQRPRARSNSRDAEVATNQ